MHTLHAPCDPGPCEAAAAPQAPQTRQLGARHRAGELRYALRRTADGLYVEREDVAHRGPHTIEVAQFAGPQAWHRWCDDDPVRFEHPHLYLRLKRDAELLWSGSRPHVPQATGAAAELGPGEADPLRWSSVAARIANAPDHRALLELLHEGARALGAPNAYFVSIAHDGTTVKSSRHLLACDPRWCRHYLNSGALAADPWLAYARVQSSPVLASALAPRDAAQRRMVALAGAHGFASALLVPAHAGTGHSRTSLLCLGSDQVGHFEADGFARARIGARILAWEMHDWWLARIREQLTQQARITPVDLALLRHQHLGHSSKRIAAELQVTQTSVNSRFQRVNHKLGVANRKLAARLACECGLIQGG